MICPARYDKANIPISIATIVDPTGVDARMETIIPAAAQITDITAEQRMTALKLLNKPHGRKSGEDDERRNQQRTDQIHCQDNNHSGDNRNQKIIAAGA